jgi:hypothetical protein
MDGHEATVATRLSGANQKSLRDLALRLRGNRCHQDQSNILQAALLMLMIGSR